MLDCDIGDNISGSEIFISTGYYDNRYFEEGQYLKLICQVNDNVAGNTGFYVDLVKILD